MGFDIAGTYTMIECSFGERTLPVESSARAGGRSPELPSMVAQPLQPLR
jgi:hypothetical protein